jgi:GAF domain-containing protein
VEAQRLRDAAWFAATLELDALSLRIVEAALAACEADGAAIGVRRPTDGSPILEALHLSEEELAWLLPGLQAENETAAVLRYPNGAGAPAEERIKTTLMVPLPGRHGDTVGNLAVVWRRDLRGRVDEQLQMLDGIANAAWSAIDNAFRFEEAQAARPPN